MLLYWLYFLKLINIVWASLKVAFRFIKPVIHIFYFIKEFRDLRDRVDKLEETVYKKKGKKPAAENAKPLPAKRKDLIHRDDLLWKKGDTTPFCPNCYEDDNKLIRMRIAEESIATTNYRPAPKKYFSCRICHYQAPVPDR